MENGEPEAEAPVGAEGQDGGQDASAEAGADSAEVNGVKEDTKVSRVTSKQCNAKHPIKHIIT